MEKVQHFLQFLFPDLPRHETCWRSPPLPLRLCAVAAGSSVSPGPLLSWRKEVAQGLAQGQLWEPGGATLTPLQKSVGEVRHQCLWWSLSGFAQHVSAIHLPSADLKW